MTETLDDLIPEVKPEPSPGRFSFLFPRRQPTVHWSIGGITGQVSEHLEAVPPAAVASDEAGLSEKRGLYLQIKPTLIPIPFAWLLPCTRLPTARPKERDVPHRSRRDHQFGASDQSLRVVRVSTSG